MVMDNPILRKWRLKLKAELAILTIKEKLFGLSPQEEERKKKILAQLHLRF